MRITTRNARFQQWESYLGNRTKRSRAGVFLVQGVRPISLALDAGWPIDTVIHRVGTLSEWANGVLDRAPRDADRVAMSEELMRELGEKDAGAPEVLLVATQRHPSLDDLALADDALVVVADRSSSPGNLGTLIRSADAFGAAAVITTGHAADPYDPQCVRATTGSLFGIPVVQAESAETVLAWRDRRASRLTVVGLDERGDRDLFDADLRLGTVLVVGNETRGMSRAWHDGCDVVARIPIGGSASSLSAPSAGTVALYEASRQRLGR